MGRRKCGKNSLRKLVLDSGTWLFKIRCWEVLLFSPKGKKYIVHHSEITGCSINQIREARWDNYLYLDDNLTNVTPGKIRKWIENNHVEL